MIRFLTTKIWTIWSVNHREGQCMGCACLVDFLRFAHLLDIRKRIVCNCLARVVDNCQMESIQNNCIYLESNWYHYSAKSSCILSNKMLDFRQKTTENSRYKVIASCVFHTLLTITRRFNIAINYNSQWIHNLSDFAFLGKSFKGPVHKCNNSTCVGHCGLKKTSQNE